MKIVRSKYLPPMRRHAAINLFGVFFVHPNVHVSERLVNHERIHTAQMRELLFLPFSLAYVMEWLVRLMMKGNAYHSISFEREAYSHEGNMQYLEHRKRYAWVKYLKMDNKKTHKRKKKNRHND